jgi:hypothetical protein
VIFFSREPVVRYLLLALLGAEKHPGTTLTLQHRGLSCASTTAQKRTTHKVSKQQSSIWNTAFSKISPVMVLCEREKEKQKKKKFSPDFFKTPALFYFLQVVVNPQPPLASLN